MTSNPGQHARSGVTLIVVTYQHGRFVDELLASIASQSTPPERVILCDDASQDHSAELMRAWAGAANLDTVLLLAERNRGLTATLNAALDHVDTPYYAYISGDDVMRPDRLRLQLALFHHRPELGFVYSDARVIDENGSLVAASFIRGLRPEGVEDSFHALLAGNWIPAPSVMVRTDAVREVGGYDEGLFLEDYDMWLRLAANQPFAGLAEPLVSWRQLPTSLGARKLHDADPDWALARVRIRAKHWGVDAHTNSAVTERVRPLLLALARQGVDAHTLAPYLRRLAQVDRRATSTLYALVSSTGSTRALRLMAAARLPWDRPPVDRH